MAGVGAAAVHVLAWPYTAAVLGVTAIYGLLAERARRRTLVDLVSRAPAGTIVVLEKGPGGPAMWVRIGSELQCYAASAPCSRAQPGCSPGLVTSAHDQARGYVPLDS